MPLWLGPGWRRRCSPGGAVAGTLLLGVHSVGGCCGGRPGAAARGRCLHDPPPLAASAPGGEAQRPGLGRGLCMRRRCPDRRAGRDARPCSALPAPGREQVNIMATAAPPPLPPASPFSSWQQQYPHLMQQPQACSPLLPGASASALPSPPPRCPHSPLPWPPHSIAATHPPCGSTWTADSCCGPGTTDRGHDDQQAQHEWNGKRAAQQGRACSLHNQIPT
jgi:hypothetical protein